MWKLDSVVICVSLRVREKKHTCKKRSIGSIDFVYNFVNVANF